MRTLESALSGHTKIWLSGHISGTLSHGEGAVRRVIAEDLSHSSKEKRYYCFGEVGGGVLTVRFTHRAEVIRIFGAGYWRKGKQIYERENPVHERTPRRPRGRS